jgi:hypothetical protein
VSGSCCAARQVDRDRKDRRFGRVEKGLSMSGAAAQIPAAGEVVLDHVGLFVPNLEAAAAGLARLGFRLTPFSAQWQGEGPGQPPVAAGTANRLALLPRGYLEVLAPIADTPLASQMRRAVDRYVGLHLIAFGSADAEADRRRLAAAGFAPLPVVHIERTLDAEMGGGQVRFSVVRVPPEAMPEGRIQYCRHHTPAQVWQPAWVEQANHAEALADVLLCVDHPGEAAARFGRFVGRAPASDRYGRVLRLDRGRIAFRERAAIARLMPRLEVPTTPFIAAVGLTTTDLHATVEVLAAGEIAFAEPRDGVVTARVPGAAMTLVFTREGAKPPWLPA